MFDPVLTSPDDKGIGQSLRRPDANAKVRGEFVYATDVEEPGMLWGATLRSPHPYARITKIDLSKAKDMPGVHAVLGAWDVPDNRHGAIIPSQQVLAYDYVRYVGEPVAIVAADDVVTARRAVAAIEVEYDVLEPELDPFSLIAQDRNIYRHIEFTHGDPSVKGDVIVEGEYSTARQDHSFMAPDAGVAKPDGRGGVIVTGATQWVHADREEVSRSLGLPPEKVLVVNAGVGGSFGGRVCMTWQIHGALLALHTDRPVKFLYTREETFHARYHRHPTTIWVRHHATKDGEIVNLEARIVTEDGPYIHTSAAGIGNSTGLIQGAYNVPNARVEGWAVATNNGMCGPLRGFGVVEPMFAVESNMDKLAHELKMDPYELRRKNAIARGDTWIFRQAQDRPTPVREIIDVNEAMPLPEPLAADAPDISLPGGVGTPSAPEYVTRGVAVAMAAKNCCLSEGAPVNSTALITLRDGKAVIDCAAAEVGQGFVTVARQIVQTVLGVSDVELTQTDTSMAPAATTDGQQQTMASGTAIEVTAQSLKRRFLRFVAREFSFDAENLDLRDDFVVDSQGSRLMTIRDAGTGLVFRATERFDHRETRPIDDFESDKPVHVTIGFGVNRCVVDVDVELGLVKVVQMDVVQDIGRVINPAQARGQVEGGSVMGQGLATSEHLELVGGHYENANWRSYHVPSIADAPTINAEFVEHPEPGWTYGWKGIAELPHVNAPPAVLGAIRAATGKDLPHAPALPEDIALSPDGPALALSQEPVHRRHGPWDRPNQHHVPKVGPWAKGPR